MTIVILSSSKDATEGLICLLMALARNTSSLFFCLSLAAFMFAILSRFSSLSSSLSSIDLPCSPSLPVAEEFVSSISSSVSCGKTSSADLILVTSANFSESSELAASSILLPASCNVSLDIHFIIKRLSTRIHSDELMPSTSLTRSAAQDNTVSRKTELAKNL